MGVSTRFPGTCFREPCGGVGPARPPSGVMRSNIGATAPLASRLLVEGRVAPGRRA